MIGLKIQTPRLVCEILITKLRSSIDRTKEIDIRYNDAWLQCLKERQCVHLAEQTPFRVLPSQYR